MFSLISVVLSILLVIALALATIYYGGSSLVEGSTKAHAARVINQGDQVASAARLFQAEHRRWPDSLTELVSGKYLSSIPSLEVRGGQGEGAPPTPGPRVAWTVRLAGRPVYVLTNLAQEVCQGVNHAATASNGVYGKVSTKLHIQCYREDGGTFTAIAALEGTALSTTLPPTAVLDGPLPLDKSDSGWAVAPTLQKPPVEAPVTPPAPTNVSIFPLNWELGSVPYTTSAHVQRFTLTNHSTARVRASLVSSATFQSGFSFNGGGYLNPGESGEVTAYYRADATLGVGAPLDGGTYRDEAVLTFVDMESGQQTAKLVVPVSVTVEPRPQNIAYGVTSNAVKWNLGEVPSATEFTKTFTLTNTAGTLSARINAFLDKGNQGFSFVNHCPTPFEGSDAKCTLVVTFRGSNSGAASGDLADALTVNVFNIYAGTSSSFRFPLTAASR